MQGIHYIADGRAEMPNRGLCINAEISNSRKPLPSLRQNRGQSPKPNVTWKKLGPWRVSWVGAGDKEEKQPLLDKHPDVKRGEEIPNFCLPSALQSPASTSHGWTQTKPRCHRSLGNTAWRGQTLCYKGQKRKGKKCLRSNRLRPGTGTNNLWRKKNTQMANIWKMSNLTSN